MVSKTPHSAPFCLSCFSTLKHLKPRRSWLMDDPENNHNTDHIFQNHIFNTQFCGPIKTTSTLGFLTQRLEQSSSTVSYITAFSDAKLSGPCPHHHLPLSPLDHIPFLACSVWASRFLYLVPAFLFNPLPHMPIRSPYSQVGSFLKTPICLWQPNL